MTTQIPVSTNSPDYQRIEYLLQLSLGTSAANVQSVKSVSRPQLNIEFERLVKKKKMLVINSFIDEEYLKEKLKIESLDSLLSQGFKFPPDGLTFTSGYFMLASPEKHVQKVVMCRIAVGKSQSVDQDNSRMQVSRDTLPEYFDSVYMMNRSNSDNNAKVFKYDYRVFDNAQVRPEYVIEFKLEDIKTASDIIQYCEYKSCESKTEPATKYCINDEMNLCDSCSLKAHENQPFVPEEKRHKIVSIDDRPKDYGKCLEHKAHPDGVPITFFCTKCNKTLCIYCKVSGSHSSGEFANHRLIEVESAYEKAKDEASSADPLIEKHKAGIKSKLKKLDEKIKEINDNASHAEQEIYRILTQALDSLSKRTQEKLDIYLADQIELRRQYEDIQWSECFLKYQYEVLPPKYYLRCWFNHIQRKTDFILNRDFEMGSTLPDLVVKGSVIVITKEEEAQIESKRNLQ